MNDQATAVTLGTLATDHERRARTPRGITVTSVRLDSQDMNTLKGIRSRLLVVGVRMTQSDVLRVGMEVLGAHLEGRKVDLLADRSVSN